jgi:hypothetical protein
VFHKPQFEASKARFQKAHGKSARIMLADLCFGAVATVARACRVLCRTLLRDGADQYLVTVGCSLISSKQASKQIKNEAGIQCADCPDILLHSVTTEVCHHAAAFWQHTGPQQTLTSRWQWPPMRLCSG